MRAFNRFLLAGTSHLAILVMGAGGAWAASGDGLSFQTDTATLYNEANGSSYSSGVLTVNGNQIGQGQQDGVHIGGDGSAIPALTVNIGARVVGGTGTAGPNSPTGITVITTGGLLNINVLSGGSIESSIGTAIATNSSPVLSIINYGTIKGTGTTANAIGVGSGGNINTLRNYGVITSQNSNVTIGLEITGAKISNIINESDGVISNTGGGSAIGMSDQAGTITNNGTILGGIYLRGISIGHQSLHLNKGSTLTGGVFSQSNGNGDIIIGNSGEGIATLNGDIGEGDKALHSLTLTNGATLAFGQDAEIHVGATSINNGGIFDLGTHRVKYKYYSGLNVSESFSGTLYFKTTINANTGKHGYWVFTQASGTPDTTMFSNGVPTIVPTVVGTAAAGSKYVIIQDTDGRTVVNMPSVINSGGYTWKVSCVTGTGLNKSGCSDGSGQTDTDGVSYGTGYTNIIITNSGTNAAGAASGTNGAGVKALAAYSGGNAAMTALSQAVNNLTSAAEIEKAGAQLRPSANGATTQAALGAVGQAVNTISVRTDSVRAASADMGGAASGVSSGEALRGLGMWGQAFGSVATQDRRLGIDGYTADTYGVAFGADAKVAEPVRLGLSFAYARTGVDDAGAREGSGQTINSYIGSLYGTYSASRWYLDGALTYGHHSYDGTRVINIAGAARQTAKSSYGGNQYGAKAEVGVPFAVGSGIVVTPLAGLAYNHLRQDGYTEKDAAAALTVGSSSTDSVKSSLGAKAAATLARWRDWDVRPNARAVWSHEFNTKAHDQTSAYVDGGAAFTNTGTDAAGESFTLGIGLDLASVRNTTLSAKYDAGLSDRYVSHTGSLQARMEF